MLFSFDEYRFFLEKAKGEWSFLNKKGLNEGIGLDENGNITIDWEKDSEKDLVYLNPIKEAKITRKSGIPVYKGYVIENKANKKEFANIVKKWNSLKDFELKTLIEKTYPEELKKESVKIIFITGSSDPLSANIASIIKETYYPNAKIIDILKAYYGIDPNDIIDWEKYDQADDTTKKMIDSYLKNISSNFEGYIKKSSGLQSGARRILKPGHIIDSFILNSLINAEKEWKEKWADDKNIPIEKKIKMLPKYLFVDDIIIEGSTLKGIFNLMLDAIENLEKEKKLSKIAKNSIYGYCLFSYKGS